MLKYVKKKKKKLQNIKKKIKKEIQKEMIKEIKKEIKILKKQINKMSNYLFESYFNVYIYSVVLDDYINNNINYLDFFISFTIKKLKIYFFFDEIYNSFLSKFTNLFNLYFLQFNYNKDFFRYEISSYKNNNVSFLNNFIFIFFSFKKTIPTLINISEILFYYYNKKIMFFIYSYIDLFLKTIFYDKKLYINKNSVSSYFYNDIKYYNLYNIVNNIFISNNNYKHIYLTNNLK